MKKYLVRKFHESKRAPLWMWLIIIFLVVAMPLFFSFVRDVQIQQVITTDTPPVPTSQ